MLKLFLVAIAAAASAIPKRLSTGPTLRSWGWAFEIGVAIDRAVLTETVSWPTRRIQQATRDMPSRLARRLEVSAVDLGGVPAEMSQPPNADDPPTLLYIHGGGFVQGSPGTHRDMVSAITLAAGSRTYSLDYRLASEHPFPAAPNDAFEAYKALLASGVDPKQLVIAGDSAGGNLCLGLLLRLREAGRPAPAAAVPICPAPDLEFPGKSWERCEKTDCLTRSMCETWIAHYVGGIDRKQPLASPIHGDFRGFPPILVQAGSAECLYDDIAALARKLESAEVEVRFSVYDEMPHVWHLFRALTPEGDRALEEIGTYVCEQTGREARSRSLR